MLHWFQRLSRSSFFGLLVSIGPMDLKSSVLVPLFHFVKKVTIGLVKVDNLVFKWYQQLSRLSFFCYWLFLDSIGPKYLKSSVLVLLPLFHFVKKVTIGLVKIDNLVFKWYQQLSRW